VAVLVGLGPGRAVVVLRVALELRDLLFGELPHQPLPLGHRLVAGGVRGNAVELRFRVDELLLGTTQRLGQLGDLRNRLVPALLDVTEIEGQARDALVDLALVVAPENGVETGDTAVCFGITSRHCHTLDGPRKG
jgi:hypothetical protein